MRIVGFFTAPGKIMITVTVDERAGINQFKPTIGHNSLIKTEKMNNGMQTFWSVRLLPLV
jgi:hypothetical protein